MKVTLRAVAVSVMLTLAWAGPLAPFAAAQQPATPPAQVAPQLPQTGQPAEMFQEQLKPRPERRGVDAYDVGAVAVTVIGLPFKTAMCAFGTALGVIVFAGTFASRPDASTRIVEEGCGGKAPWIVRGSDLRPRPAPSKAFDWETHRFDWER
jgi:hypothetical protein